MNRFEQLRNAAFAPHLSRHGMTWAAYSALETLWRDGDLTCDEIISRIDLEGEGRNSSSKEVLNLGSVRRALSGIKRGRLVRVMKGKVGEVFRISRRGVEIYERIHEMAMGGGAWLSCVRREYLGRNILLIDAPTWASIWWGLTSVAGVYVIKSFTDPIAIDAWRFNSHKVFTGGYRSYVEIVIPIAGRAARREFQESLPYRSISEVGGNVLSVVPPFVWKTGIGK